MKTKHSNRPAMWMLGLIVGGGLLAALWSADGFGKETAAQPQWNAYKIVIDQNMFSRNRRPPVERDARPVVRPPDPNIETYYILRGIAREDGTFIAFLQDNKQGGVLKKREGEELARGKIKSLSLDSLEYQSGKRTRTIQIGYDLEGGKSAISIRNPSNGSSGPRPPGGDMQSRSRQDRFGGDTRQGGSQSNGRRDRGMGMSSTSRISTPSTSSDTPAGDEAEILRRLMERRQEQLGQSQQ